MPTSKFKVGDRVRGVKPAPTSWDMEYQNFVNSGVVATISEDCGDGIYQIEGGTCRWLARELELVNPRKLTILMGGKSNESSKK